MGFRERVRALIFGRPTLMPLEGRHQRREAARRRHRETGAPAWTDEDRHLGPEGVREVADVAPGTPGHIGSVRSTRGD